MSQLISKRTAFRGIYALEFLATRRAASAAPAFCHCHRPLTRSIHITPIAKDDQPIVGSPPVPLEPVSAFPNSPPPAPIKGTLWFDNVFPRHYVKYDIRWPWLASYSKRIVETAKERFIPKNLPADFEYLGATPNMKEGGLFVHFKYNGESAQEVVDRVNKYMEEQHLRSWVNLNKIRAYYVKGEPWVDDMVGRLPSRQLRVEFAGPDVSVEKLYRDFRPYGRINNITLLPPNVKDLPRYAVVEFIRVRSATSARNCLNGELIDGTRISINYEGQKQTFAKVWNWMTSHPRIVIPLLLAMFAGLSYAVFDPIRVFFIENQLTGRFSLKAYKGAAEEWWYSTASSVFGRKLHDSTVAQETWTERQEDFARLQHHLKQTPDTLVLVSGPKGSGKSALVKKVLEHAKYKIVIHCDELAGQPNHIMLKRLASQINFKPMFNGLVQMSSLLDAMITATTGAKAGLSTTDEGQIKQMFELLSAAVARVAEEQRETRKKALLKQARHAEKGTGPDAVAADAKTDKILEDIEYPVVVVEGFLASEVSKSSVIYDMILEWGASAAENHLAHVVYISDNPIALKTISKALPNKTIELYALSDATPENALALVKKRLEEPVDDNQLREFVNGLGGRLTDLEMLIQKIRAGMTIDDAYKEIVFRAVNEVRKVGLGEDATTTDTSHKIRWSPVQFWKVVQILSKAEEVSYDGLRFNAHFKGDEGPIQAMERAGLIGITYDNGRPYGIRASRPVFRTAFQHMLMDQRLSATMGILTTKQQMADEEANIKGITAEMNTLDALSNNGTVKRPVKERLDDLRKGFEGSLDRLRRLGAEQGEYKKVISLPE
ncbi:RNA12 protein-domain-containing protein [Fimicolochytrium jonesii]|uniref:RNA12 protein-domain-containing protein n=1 Tax=Fimicolochytrium jonesii TaxID=1396493 RepID=UPI0022FEE263|nr:RNA12 protein-domain-containing protein [Fimicolochytrium jonesii]KAI8820540.1 RNA12 protein-domain-containing protein [Fimicolochytrium jonesii]